MLFENIKLDSIKHRKLEHTTLYVWQGRLVNKPQNQIQKGNQISTTHMVSAL